MTASSATSAGSMDPGGKRSPSGSKMSPPTATSKNVPQSWAARSRRLRPSEVHGLRSVELRRQKIQIFQFTQSSIATPLIAYLSDEEIEQEPHLYDFVLSATGTGKDKRYSVASLPGRRRKENIDGPIKAAWKKAALTGWLQARRDAGRWGSVQPWMPF